MKTNEFNFDLPEELIARHPLPNRTESRLLCLNDVALDHRNFNEFPTLLNENDVIIFNNTRVIPARFFANKITGGKVEILIERILDDQVALAHIKANKPLRIPSNLQLPTNETITVVDRQRDLFRLEFQTKQSIREFLAEFGSIPLPPYMQRSATDDDKDRYQTVYASEEGAVAAPTAGLHFDQSLLAKLAEKGIKTGFITLHVGAGTFKPVTVENIAEHQMHHEIFNIPPEVCTLINNCQKQGGRVIAVGTTTVRALETAAQKQQDLTASQGETNIFIYPGYQFKCVDAMVTNFHLPKSTLLMLVCAFGGYQNVMSSYEIAIANRYRFYSYGDAMLVFHKPHPL